MFAGLVLRCHFEQQSIVAVKGLIIIRYNVTWILWSVLWQFATIRFGFDSISFKGMQLIWDHIRRPFNLVTEEAPTYFFYAFGHKRKKTTGK